MYTVSPTNYNNRPAFTAFAKPEKPVLELFQSALEELNSAERLDFVKSMASLVKSQENIKVPIQHTVVCGYVNNYGAVVGGKTIICSKHAKKSSNILEAMQTACSKALNIQDINNNMAQINRIFDIRG